MRNSDDTDDKPSSMTESKDALNFAITFHCNDGRTYGFPYGHLIYFAMEKNSTLETHPQAAPDQLRLVFATHIAKIFGWRLQRIVAALRAGHLTELRNVDPRMVAESNDRAVVNSIFVMENKEDDR